jgi:hypothetical protein
MGLSEPVRSGRGGLLPGELQDKLLAFSDIDATGDWSVPQNPGTLWQELAADLFLANGEARQWGWCDTRHAPFLSFWKAFDPQILFVLTYTPPEYAMAAALHVGDAGLEAVSAAAQEWVRFNETVLRFYMGNQDRCLLINTRGADFSRRALGRLLSERFGLQLAQERWLQPEQSEDALEALLARQMLLEAAEAADVFHSLESVADISYGDESPGAAVAAALQQLRGLHAQLRESNTRLTEESSTLTTRLRDCNDQLAAERDAWSARLQECTAHEQEVWAAKMSALESDAREQHESLLQQLRESQAELDVYSGKIEEILGAQASAPAAPTSDASAAIEQAFDVRRGFAGDNWYDPEEDGRWAGPNDISTVRMPRLAPARYALSLDVAAAMAPDILEGTRCYIKGMEVALEGAWAGCPATLYGEFTVLESNDEAGMELQFQFPRTLSPAAQGSDPDDRRALAIRLRAITIRALETQE